MEESELLTPLQGAHIERVDRPLRGLYAFSLTSDALRCVLLLTAGPPRHSPAWALVTTRPKGESADAQVRGLREKLEGAHIVSFVDLRDGWTLIAERSGSRWRLEGRREGLACVPDLSATPVNEPVCAPHLSTAPIGKPAPPTEGALAQALERGEAFVEEHRRHEDEWARREALTTLRRARARLVRRLAAVEADLAAIEKAQARSLEIAPFVASAARAPQGASELEAVDWSSGEAKAVKLAIDPTAPARKQLDAIFARAKRLRAGAPLAERRRDEATLAIWSIDEALPAIESAANAAAITSLVEALSRELPRDLPLAAPKPSATPRERSRAQPEREPFRRYEGEGGLSILVGRDAASNDELTVRVAKPGDLWLHARDGAGSHVVVPGGYKQGSPDAHALVDAATLAAHFSSLKGEAIIDVLFADRRHVRKRKGSARGEVEVLRSKTLALRTEPERLARLLATYRPTPA